MSGTNPTHQVQNWCRVVSLQAVKDRPAHLDRNGKGQLEQGPVRTMCVMDGRRSEQCAMRCQTALPALNRPHKTTEINTKPITITSRRRRCSFQSTSSVSAVP